MKRREFIIGFGGAVVSSLVANAQQQAMPVIGFLNSASPGPYRHLVAGFLQGLKELGYVDGQNVLIEYRWAEGQYDRLPALVADLIGRGVNIIAALSTPAAMAAEASKTTIPIIFDTAGDPVRLGLVASLNRPGRNITGVSQLGSELVAKRLGLMHDLIPQATIVGLLVNPADPRTRTQRETCRRRRGTPVANQRFECQHRNGNCLSIREVGRTTNRRSRRRNWRALQ